MQTVKAQAPGGSRLELANYWQETFSSFTNLCPSWWYKFTRPVCLSISCSANFKKKISLYNNMRICKGNETGLIPCLILPEDQTSTTSRQTRHNTTTQIWVSPMAFEWHKSISFSSQMKRPKMKILAKNDPTNSMGKVLRTANFIKPVHLL